MPVAGHGTFTYTIPDPLRDSVRLGSRVEVEIGTKLTTGFVVGFNDSTDAKKLKPVRSVLDEDEPPLLPATIHPFPRGPGECLAPAGERLPAAQPGVGRGAGRSGAKNQAGESENDDSSSSATRARNSLLGLNTGTGRAQP